MGSNTKNVKLGVCQVFYDNVDLGYTKGGVEVSVATETHEVNVDQFGKTPINQLIMGRSCKVKCPLAETTLENLTATMPGSYLTDIGGVAATGTITIATQPTNGQTIVVGGTTFTFKTAPVGIADVLIGASTAATATNLAALLNVLITQATYTVATSVVTVTYGMKGTEGNTFAIATGTAGASVTVSGAVLTGGVNSTSKYVEVQSGVGIELLSIAKELRLHPVNRTALDLSEDFIVPLAGTAGALTFAYKIDDERVFNVEFTGYPDPVTKRLFLVGGRP